MSNVNSFLTIFMIGAAIWMGTFVFAKSLKRKDLDKSTFQMFSWMQVFTACGFAFSHGANDIANAIGPFAAIMDVLRTNSITAQNAVPPIAMLTFGIALIVGLWFVGKEVIKTVGTSLAETAPSVRLLSRAFCCRRRDGRIIYGLACFQYPYLGRCSFGYRLG